MFASDKIAAAVNELESLRKERTDHWQIPRAEGELLHHLAIASRAKLIVEVGTSYGFSGLFWGDAARRTGGHVHTIDKDPRKVEMSRATFVSAGLGTVITNHLGDGAHVIPTLPSQIDIAFIDADKPATERYVELLWPKLRAGGMLLIDNATTHRAELAGIVGKLRARTDASSCEVAIGNGIEWTIKLK
jgi:predicted O-methyltransferase YrrM